MKLQEELELASGLETSVTSAFCHDGWSRCKHFIHCKGNSTTLPERGL